MKYIVIEIQTSQDGAVGNIVNSYDSRNQAEQQFHTILAAAAVSQLAIHTAVLMTNSGETLSMGVYTHGNE